MQTIGLLGGMSWESTAEYYRIINQEVQQEKGGLHSAKIVLHSVDFAPLEKLMGEGDWQTIGEVLAGGAKSLERAGADFFLLCTNTMHKVADQITDQVQIPMLHIADATAEQLKAHSYETVGLLGTAFTMEEDFYRHRLEKRHGVRVLVPDDEQRSRVNSIIFAELCRGMILEDSREEYLKIIRSLVKRGSQAVVLGCTEIGLLVRPHDVDIPLLDTTRLHARKAVEAAFRQSGA